MQRRGATLAECLAASVCLAVLSGGVAAGFGHIARVQRSIVLRNAALFHSQMQFESYRLGNATTAVPTVGNVTLSGPVAGLPGASYALVVSAVQPTGADYVNIEVTTTATDGRVSETVRLATAMRISAIGS